MRNPRLSNAVKKRVEYLVSADIGMQAKVEQSKSQMSTRRMVIGKMAKEARSRPKTGKRERRANWNDKGLISGEGKNNNIGKSHRLVDQQFLNS